MRENSVETEYAVTATVAEYEAAVAALAAGSGPVAVDAERASGFRYSQRAYLIQMFRRDAGVFLFDPIALTDAVGPQLTALQQALVGEEWVLHAASQDLACLREVGLDPARIFDTELAARLLGLPRVGLGPLTESLLGIHLAKEHSAADWSTRPLPQAWLTYAALDVELLVDLRDEVEKLLVEQGKLEIAEQEFHWELVKEAKAPRAEPWRRLSGIHSIRGIRNLAVARELWLARDALARERDSSPGRLVPDAALTAVAKAMPASKRELAGLKEFTGRASRSELDRWWAAIEAGRTTEDLPVPRSNGDSIPPVRAWADRNPAADARYKRARERVQEYAQEHSFPVENVLTPELLRRVAWEPPQPVTTESVAAFLGDGGARPWQIEATAELIASAFVEADQAPREADDDAS
ncbi:HRDC domain-containing protein [Gryllotalpicola ginsengisoli]|uniref:HRDC domain-containing protein n=1 Tax=Gryllotalpicola ginsengisoli TaxID=444608 RepID=UPI0003B55F8C|nr:HRDC domain-containing protein [Gryllotalpicola ginsengisoli]